MEKLEKENIIKNTKNEIPSKPKSTLIDKSNNIDGRKEVKHKQKKFFNKKDIMVTILSIISFYFFY